jgi:hypothetical protein
MFNREDICDNIQKFIIFSLLGVYGITVVLAYLIGSLLAPNLSSLNCIRSEHSQFSCESISSGIFGTYKTQIPSGQLQLAEVEESCDGGDCSYKVTLKTTRGKISLTAYSDNYESDAQEKADRINRAHLVVVGGVKK